MMEDLQLFIKIQDQYKLLYQNKNLKKLDYKIFEEISCKLKYLISLF